MRCKIIYIFLLYAHTIFGGEGMESVWAEASMPRFAALERDIRTDVLIIGGGIAGILAAHALHCRGVDCVIAEAMTICGGVTQNTTAKITAQHGFLYDKLIRTIGIDKAGLYLRANTEALERYSALSASIACDFEEKDAFAYSLHDAYTVERELRALERLGYPAKADDCTALPFAVAGAVRFPKQAQFHPLRFLREIAKHLHIYEHTEITELADGIARTTGGTICAQKIILTTHFPILNKHGSYFLKLYQQRAYVTAIRGGADVGGMYIDGDGGLSFRNSEDLLLIGSGSRRTGLQSSGWQKAKECAARYYPTAKIAYQWATQDCMSLDGVPYVGQYSARTPNLYVATGFNKWGMTSAMAAAELLADLICGKENEYASVFSPSRSILHPTLAVNAFGAAVNLLRPTVPRCPHLGCALRWNAREHSWDCPCHGSRFDTAGKLLNNPATGNLKKKPPRRKNH